MSEATESAELDQLLRDAEAGFAAGLKPRRHRFLDFDDDGKMCGCAVVAAYITVKLGGRVPHAAFPVGMAIIDSAARHYGLAMSAVSAFMSGFDSGPKHPVHSPSPAFQAGLRLARKVFQEQEA
jgi:hypothetical protein